MFNLCSRIARIVGALRTEPDVAAKIAAVVERSWTKGDAASSAANVPSLGPSGNSSTGATQRHAELDVAWRHIQGRLALASGDAARALQTFESTAKQVALSEWDPETLRDYAVSAVLQRKYDVAATLYRRLVAVSTWLPAADRVAVRIEAAMALLRVTQPAATAVGYTEALGYLEGLDTYQVDSRLAELTEALTGIVEVMSGGARGDGARRGLPSTERSLRSIARLREEDWRLLDSWRDWSRSRDAEVWSWVNAADVPNSFRMLAQRLTAER